MNRKISILLIISFVSAVGFFNSCKKSVSGCMDSQSVNYNSSATKDDGSCKYQAKMMCWWDASLASNMSLVNIRTIRVSANGSQIGTITYSGQSWSSAPACRSVSANTFVYDLGQSKSASVTYKFDGYDYFGSYVATENSSTYTLLPNDCITIQL
jgi:hypothetical protein